MVDIIGDNLSGAAARAAAHWQVLKPADPPTRNTPGLIAPPSQYLYSLRAGMFTLTSVATVAVGAPTINLVDGDGTVIFTQSTGVALAAAGTVTVAFGVGIGVNAPANALAIPDIEIPPGLSWQLGISSGFASVQVSAIRAFIIRIPFGDGGRAMSGLPPADLV